MSPLKTPSIELLTSEVDQLDIDPANSYLISYPEFLDYFRQTPVINRHHLIIATHFTYGWMPRALTMCKGDLTKAAELLNHVKAGVLLREDELERLKEIVNNSMVGVSKLLHFINPDLYGIWDSHVARYLSGKDLSYQSMRDVTLYMKYLNMCQNIIQWPDYELIHNSVVEKVGYQMTQLRTVELLMFWSARTYKRSNRFT